ncbi:RNA polymerase sigma factor, RpoD/SigA family [Alkalinema sp. FACHB-956]|uniref:RNA polymerase sigma factor, RpoD/SigA family n=1 Tax=Alkalinema sp. FACHB-956 TaxID=2692768 RepID=UPI002410B96D|nr:RNA polymerase sigma factor, RpoD/SigA family [Alkalinema sp. FACHB-956]
MRSYLQDIGRVPLLTREEEIQYGQQVQKRVEYQAVKAALAARLGHDPSLEEWAAELELTVDELEAVVEAGEFAKRRMVEANLRLVVNIAKQYQNRNVDLLDLIQEGALGLQMGVEKFDPDRGFKFSTYAYWWIRQAITRAISQSSRTIRLPIHLVEALNKIKRSQRELSQKLGRTATLNEIATELDLEPEKVLQYLSYAKRPMSLDMKVGDNEDTDLVDILEDESTSPAVHLEKVALSQDLQSAIGELPPIMQEILVMRFGLDGNEALSLSEAGRRLGMSRERVRQIQQKAYKLLRQGHSEIRHYLAS